MASGDDPFLFDHNVDWIGIEDWVVFVENHVLLRGSLLFHILLVYKHFLRPININIITWQLILKNFRLL